jgi:hypothetical protein
MATEKPLTEMCLMYLATLTPITMAATPYSHVPRGTAALAVTMHANDCFDEEPIREFVRLGTQRTHNQYPHVLQCQ